LNTLALKEAHPSIKAKAYIQIERLSKDIET